MAQRLILKRGALLLGLIFLLFLIVGALPYVGSAQKKTELTISQLSLGIWPEYDDPRLLVIYTGKFQVEKTDLPIKVKFLIPKDQDAQTSLITAFLDEKEKLQTQSHKVTEKEQFAEVSFDLQRPNFQVEFYYNPFKGDTKKSFEYLFQSTYPVSQLQVEVKKPLKATDFQLNPAPVNQIADQQGFQNYYLVYNNVSKGKTIKTKVTYTKTDPGPSIQKGQTAQTAGGSTSQTENKSSVSPFVILVAVGFSLILIIGAYWITTTRNPAQAVSTLSSKRGTTSSAIKYCANCGAQLRKGNKFCPNCGGEVRRR